LVPVQEKEAGGGMIGPFEWLIILTGKAPALVFWIAVIIFAAVWLRRGGGRAERFMIAGASIKIIGNLLSIPLSFLPLWLIDMGDFHVDAANSIVMGCGIFLNAVSMAGIICLVYAFWVKFTETRLSRDNVEIS
jgi:hypothetical protein